VLTEASRSAFEAVERAKPRGDGLGMQEFKHIIDEAAQEAIVESLTGSGVDARLVSEEGDRLLGGSGREVVVADPVDGTTNLSRGLQPAAICLSVSTSASFRDTYVAVVKDLYSGATYTAEKGKGATLGGRPLSVSRNTEPKRSLISLDISKTSSLDRYLPLLREARYIRMLGCSSKDLCHVASGVFDAHIDVRGSLRSTDVAAALLILTEAGGCYAADGVTGGDFQLTREENLELVAASTPLLLKRLVDLTREL
jgi:myo-inositol-1(or 4)-monophosphatase